MDCIKLLHDISITDRLIAGGKCSALGALTQDDFQVPKGFVVLTKAFENFLATHALTEKRDELKTALATELWQRAREIAQDIHQQILTADIPETLAHHIETTFTQLGMNRVAVRSSAVEEDAEHAAWAGILSTYLNTGSDDLYANIKHCWASLFTEQTIDYLQSRDNTSPDLQMAVVVQSMINSEVAGVAFSINPVTLDNNQIVIEAAAGLGEGQVSGAVTPDNYIVDKDTWHISNTVIASQKTAIHADQQGGIQTVNLNEHQQSKLADDAVIVLAKKVAAIAEQYDMPVDVEWAWADKQFYILQSRPVSNLGTLPLEADNIPKQQIQSADQTVEYEFWWSDHLAYWAHDVGFNVLHWHRDILWNQYDDFLAYIKEGTAYGYLSKRDMATAQKRGDLYLQTDYLPTLEKVRAQCIADHEQIYAELTECVYPEVSNQDMRQLFLKTIDIYGRTITHYKASCPFPTTPLHQALSQYFSAEELRTLSLPTHLDIMALEQMDWMALTKQPFSEKRLLDHAAEHAWFFMSHFTYDEVIETLTQLFHEDREQTDANAILLEKQNLQQEQEAILSGREEHLPLVNLWQAISAYRIALKGCWASVDFHLIPMLNEICRRSGESITDLTSYYRVEDIVQLLDSGEILPDSKKAERESGTLGVWSNGELSYYFGSDAERVYQEKVEKPSAAEGIRGMVAHRGGAESVSGTARILECNNAAQARELGQSFKEGDVLVTPMTQLNIWHIIKRASAIVTDEGGMLSHAAIVARENDIPCIVGTGTATFVIQDGDQVTVDLTRGTVRV